MKKIVFPALVLLATPFCTYGQESPYTEDLQFVRELRSRGYSDLAREYLDKLAKTASPALKKELPLEQALTQMETANDEPDSRKRITLYAQARAQFEAFLKANPKHPRAEETRLDIARATTLQGKTELSRAMLEEDLTARIAAGDKARETLIKAFNDLKKLPETEKTKLAMALNLLDQSETYLNTGNEAATGNSIKRIQEAREILEPFAQGEARSKITWEARAWAGRCEELLDTPKNAIDVYQGILRTTGTAAQDGRRLALYFNMLAQEKLNEAPNPKTPLPTYLINQARTWLRLYANYKRTPEGYGVQYLLATYLLKEAVNPKYNPRLQTQLATEARRLLSSIERTENVYTDRAKRLKIAAMDKQGTFKNPIDRLSTFEDCYVRAQYEQMQIAEDVKKAESNKSQEEEARKTRFANIIQALQLGLKIGLKKPVDEEFKNDLKNAQALLTFYLLQQGKSKEAIEVGEQFARKDGDFSNQAASAAIYALVAYGQELGKRESRATGRDELQEDQSYKDQKQRMLALARLMEKRWPKERAGNVARHEIALDLLRQDKNPEAITELAAITDTYPSYIRTQYLLAYASLQEAAADQEDKKGYRKRALAALSKLPDPPATADVETNSNYVQGKLLLSQELVRAKKLKEVDTVLAALKAKLSSLKLDKDADKEKEKRRKFQDGLVQLSLYSTVLQADTEFKAAKYKEVGERLDPLVDQFNDGKLPQLKDSVLAPSLIGMDLRANVQLNNLKRARAAIQSLQALQTGEGADTTTTILAQLVSLITQQVEELRKKGDKDNLKQAQDGFTAILDDVVGKKKPDAKLAYLLARCYAGMGEHKKAADLLATFAAKEDIKEPPLLHVIQLLLVQEYRQLKKTDKARALLDDIIKGKDGKPGWGARDINAQKTHVMLLEDEEKYASAYHLCDRYVKQLVRRLDDNRLKEYYFEFYYHMVFCFLKHGQGMANAKQKAKAIHDAASLIVNLEKGQPDFGGKASKKRFDELLAKETELREEYNTLKGGK